MNQRIRKLTVILVLTLVLFFLIKQIGITNWSSLFPKSRGTLVQDVGTRSDPNKNLELPGDLERQMLDFDSQGLSKSEAIKIELCRETSANVIFEKIVNKSSIQKRQLIVENIHFIDSDGIEKRIHITPDEESASEGKMVLQLFKKDREGYPERIETSKTKEDLLQNKKVIYSEIEESILLQDSQILHYTMVNQSVTSLELASSGFVLNCREATCSCSVIKN